MKASKEESSPNMSSRIKILVLGDGNFSFSLDLAHKLSQLHDNWYLVATSFDDRDALIRKYPDSFSHVMDEFSRCFHNHEIQIQHGVDATIPIMQQLRCCDQSSPSFYFHHVIFNFPHLGIEDCVAHSAMCAHVMQCVADILVPDAGLFYLSLSRGQFVRWNIQQMASRNKFDIAAEVPLTPRDWPTWELKRHQNGKSFKDRVDSCYHFTLRLNGSGKDSINDPSQDHATLEHANLFVLLSNAKFPRAPLLSDKISDNRDSAMDLKVSTNQGEGVTLNPSRKKKRKVEALTEGMYKVLDPSDNDNGDCENFECNTCAKRFSSLQAIRTHVYVEHILKNEEVQSNDPTSTISEKEFTCSDCGKILKSKDAFLQHRTAKHNGPFHDIKPAWAQSERQRCTISTITTTTTATATETATFECPVCGLHFESQHLLVEHGLHGFQPKEYMSEEKSFTCHLCQKICKDERALKQHINYCSN